MNDLATYSNSPAFDSLEKKVLDLAVQMATTPPGPCTELVEDLRTEIGEAAVVELVSSIAWEHYRARFNRALDVRPAGFSEGAVCALPEVPR